MNVILILFAGLLCAGVSWTITGMIRRRALREGMLDEPGARSLHRVATPRGGGIAISVCTLIGTMAVYAAGLLPASAAAALVIGGALVALVGWLDDSRGLTAWTRGLAYYIAAVFALICVGGVDVAGIDRLALLLIAALALAWLVNLYNFMDGSDGLAAIEAVSVGTLAAAFYFGTGTPGPGWVCWLLCSAAAGFLVWNWAPAKIFMGDTGSCFLGFAFGVVALIGARMTDTIGVWTWAILLGAFWIDATLTLLRRLLAREPWYSPHRTHAYQLLVLSGMTHRLLAVSVAAVNLLFLAPLAYLSVVRPQLKLYCLLAAFAVLAALWAAIQSRYLRLAAARQSHD